MAAPSLGIKALRTATITAILVLALVKRALQNRKPRGRKALANGAANADAKVVASNGARQPATKAPPAPSVSAGVSAGSVITAYLGGSDSRPAISTEMKHNMQRQAAIAHGGPLDHAGSVVIVPTDAFDLNKTIFKSLSAVHLRYVARAKLGNDLFWSDGAMCAIRAAYSGIPAAPSVDTAIVDFMAEECDFSMEHADGSFMDHLHFCHDYSAAHYKEHSPRVLLLHSILGVGTNCFPMTKDKVPKLKAMLTDFEFKHIEAFPSILRLLNAHAFIEELSANRDRLDKLESVSFFRVIDNQPLTMSAEDLWINLNFQVIHQLDFLPAACWASQMSEPLFATFVETITFMRETGRLKAHVDFEHPSGEVDVQGQPLTLGACIFRFLPSKLMRKSQIREIAKYSKAVGHSLDYKLQWAA